MRVFRVLLVLCLGAIFSCAEVCGIYQQKLQEYEFGQVSAFKTAYKNATDDELWNIAAKECDENKPTAFSACIYLYKNVLKQNFDNKNVAKINLFTVLDKIMGFYVSEKQKDSEANFINYKIAALVHDEKTAAKALHDGGYLTKEQYKKISDIDDAVLTISTFAACPNKYDPSKTQPFLPNDKIRDACLCLLKLPLLIKDEDYLTAAKLGEILCKKYKDGGACLFVGATYKEGLGVRANVLQAKEYFGLACDYGNQDGCSKYKALYY